MPSIGGQTAQVIDVLHVPGDDDLADIDLLEYPFLVHEVGHNILFRNDAGFIATFAHELDAVLAAIQRQTIGIRGSAKHLADSTALKMREFWTPTADQFNWAHEIAVDVVAVWLCGPAYLAALQDVMEAADLNPYQLGQSHPPYEIRAKALIDAAERLSWAYYTGGIQNLVDRWSAAALSEEKTNLHVACADARLLTGAVVAALQACRSLALPCCTPASVSAVDQRRKRGEPLEFGADVIVGAWAVHKDVTQAEYDEWERSIIKQLS